VPDGDRIPLDEAALARAIIRAGTLYRELRVTGQTGSTNADLLESARAGAGEGVVLVAEEQTAGRGRIGRTWVSPPRAALLFSVLLRPVAAPGPRRGWLPLLTGMAVASALRGTGVDASLKWPNDVLIHGRKVAGILTEQAGDAIVVGAGINVTTRLSELPPGPATSLLASGAACTARDTILINVLGELERRYRRWLARPGDPQLRSGYREASGTLGRQVRVELPGGRVLEGTAADIDDVGRLVVRTASGDTAVSAGDVVHVR
jgi:BirA family transcriptional regulator, biotin operon repressor / biotin---[acetyl-CoA-carboxylase] ligase